MATEFALIPENEFFLKADGTLASGYQLFIYTAGSSTKATTHRDSDGLVANTNPIVLDSLGQTPYGVYVASGTYKTILASDTDTDPPGTAIRTRDNITPRNDTTTTQSEWVASGLTPTFVSSTQFTLVGDQTSLFHVGRRLKTTDSSGTDYATITASAYTSLTTVTIGTANLDSGLSAVSYSLLSAASSSIPHIASATTGLTVGSSLTLTQGADVASATDLLIGIPGNAFDVTGTTTIATLATKGIGTHVTLQFDGALTLTHSADLFLPGAADITTAAGDVAVFYEYAAADWRCVSYTRAARTSIVLGTYGALASTSTVISGIPSWARMVRVSIFGMSWDATAEPTLRLGDSGGIEATGYAGVCNAHQATPSGHALSTGFDLADGTDAASAVYDVVATLTLLDPATNRWSAEMTSGRSDTTFETTTVGSKALDSALTQLSITTTAGSASADAGNVNIAYW